MWTRHQVGGHPRAGTPTGKLFWTTGASQRVNLWVLPYQPVHHRPHRYSDLMGHEVKLAS